MKKLKTVFFVLVILFQLVGCAKKSETDEATAAGDSLAGKQLSISGNYVDDNYSKRNEGYDWIAVAVYEVSDSVIKVSVRSRSDKKKPTCTFDAEAKKIGENKYASNNDGIAVIYTFSEESITIGTEASEENDKLQYYCSGGGNFAGEYKKVKEYLDEKQIDPRIFIKTLSLQNIVFDVNTVRKDGKLILNITPFGLKIDNSKVTHEIEGTVVNAEVEDLNSDGSPELLVYVISRDNHHYGNVIGYSVNNGKSMSQIAFPPISENAEAHKVYDGHDEFAIVETTLVRRFKTYASNDDNSKPTGNMKQVEYKLKEGEASRKFEISKVTEF